MENKQAVQAGKRRHLNFCKRFLLSGKVVVALIMVALLFLNLPKPLEKVVQKAGAAVTFHFDSAVDGAEFKGSSYRLVCSSRDEIKNFKGLIGTEIVFEGSLETVDELLKYLAPVNLSHEEVDGVVVYTGRSALISGNLRTSKGLINFQIAFSQDTVTVGSPVIFGSY